MSTRRHRRTKKRADRRDNLATNTHAEKPLAVTAARWRLASHLWSAATWRSGCGAFLAFCTMTGLITFWPRVSISMASDPDQTLWLYAVTNDSLFAVTNVDAQCNLTSMGFGYQGGDGTINNIAAFAPKHRQLIRPRDVQTFECPSFVVEHPSLDQTGSVDIQVTYNYARFIKRHEHACYELALADEHNRRVWARQACP
jgi:hypothetical protein